VAEATRPEQVGGSRRETLPGGSLDDQLWLQAIVTANRLDERYIGPQRELQDDEHVLHHLLRRGVFDHDDFDKRWDSTTRSMRYSAAVGDRLWCLLEAERSRVRLVVSFIFLGRQLMCL
jgi:hypothetical protein